MLIVSKFHDYYDTAMSYGIDKTCVYNRDTVELDLKRDEVNLPYFQEWKFSNGIALRADPVIIGFCGKLYPMIIVSGLYGSTEKPQCFYDSQSYLDFVRETIGYEMKPSRRYSFWHGRGDLTSEAGVKEFFNNDLVKLQQKFIDHKTPIFLISAPKRDFKITLNPKLDYYRFMTVIDPATAFQEIYMFKAGVLGSTEVDTVQIDDKHMLTQKGFDKHSFKTMKGDKKPRAKNRNKID